MTDIIRGSPEGPDRPPEPPAEREHAMIASTPKTGTATTATPEVVSNRRHAREQEGFGRTLGGEDTTKSQAISCTTMMSRVIGLWASDSRGWFQMPASLDRRHIEW